jgi:hypothetical protein
MEDLSGGWLGTYWYHGRLSPCRFEATLTHATRTGKLSGSVLDDGRLGMASVSGAATGPTVAFTKVYRNPGLEPIAYEGTVAEDGRSMAGTWAISRQGRIAMRGTWEMHRTWAESAAEAETAEQPQRVEAVPAGSRALGLHFGPLERRGGYPSGDGSRLPPARCGRRREIPAAAVHLLHRGRRPTTDGRRPRWRTGGPAA